MPTAIELCWCFVAGAALVIAQFGKYTLLSTVTRTVSQSVVGTTYKTDVLAPVHRIAGNGTIMTIMLELLWSVVGVVVYELAAFFVKRFTDWESAEHAARFAAFGQIVPHSLVRTLLERWLWRIVIGLVALSFTVFFVPYAYRHWLTGVDFYMASIGQLMAQIAGIILLWSFIFHIYIVLLRLYATRVRLFGKIVY
jgi:hypothetical protein